MITPEQMAGDTEHSHQVALCIWVAQNIDKYPELKWLTAIPNGGLRNAAVANKLKAEGVKPGVPDLLLAVRHDSFPCLWIEMKRPETDMQRSGKLTREQKEWINNLRSQGHKAVVCYGWKYARDEILNYLGVELYND